MRWLKTPATKSAFGFLACQNSERTFVHTQVLCFINYTNRHKPPGSSRGYAKLKNPIWLIGYACSQDRAQA